MAGKDAILIAILAVAMVAVAAALFITFSGNDDEKVPTDPVDPVDPIDPVDPGPQYPEGISFDSKTGELTSETSVDWTITNELLPFKERVSEKHSGTSVSLEPGLYSVSVGADTFNVIADGSESRTIEWDYLMDGKKIHLSVTFDVDMRELAEKTLANREWNNGWYNNYFSNLTSLVSVNDSIRSIVQQLTTLYTDNGGSMDDIQTYVDFLSSFAQLGIKYPQWETVPGTTQMSSDYYCWGQDEYWCDTLETLYLGKGDCEDSSAVACAILKAAGFSTAMVGGPGHVMAAVALDSFTERNLVGYNISVPLDLAVSSDAYYVTDKTHTYYGIETIKGQTPTGYLMKGQLKYINATSSSGAMRPQGYSGYYAV